MSLELRNPHSVIAALQTRPNDVAEIRLHAERPSAAWQTVARMARQNRIPVSSKIARQSSGGRRQQRSPNNPGRTGAGEAIVKQNSGTSIDELFSDASARRSGHGVWLALDCLQDPQNVGAVFRSAAFFGIEGVIVTKDRSAPLNATVYDVASGAMEYVPFVVQTNLNRAFKQAQEAGLWILGSSEHAETDVANVPLDRPWLVAIGNEEKGLRRLTLDKCDAVCRIAPRGKITSLNVSVAAGVLMSSLTVDG